MNRFIANVIVATILLATPFLRAGDVTAPGKLDDTAVVNEGIVAAPIDEVWRVFSTAEGFKKLGVAQAKIDFRPGGMLWSAYDPAAELGSPQSIGTEILAIDPGRSVTTRIKQPPEGFPFMEAYKTVSTTISLADLGDGRTHVRIAMFGYNDTEESHKMRTFFEHGNAFVLKKLQSAYDSQTVIPAKPHEAAPLSDLSFTQLVNAPREDVYRTFTTSAGWKAFFNSVDSKIGQMPGEPMEVYFASANPEGKRGSEGCKILSVVPDEMFSFTWNAPPSQPVAREHQTWVVVQFDAVSPTTTKVTLRHFGFKAAADSVPGHDAEFAAARGHFVQGWAKVLEALSKHFGVAK